jgi:hypothetical protein
VRKVLLVGIAARLVGQVRAEMQTRQVRQASRRDKKVGIFGVQAVWKNRPYSLGIHDSNGPNIFKDTKP